MDKMVHIEKETLETIRIDCPYCDGIYHHDRSCPAVDCLDYMDHGFGWYDLDSDDGWINTRLESRKTFEEVCEFIDEKYISN